MTRTIKRHSALGKRDLEDLVQGMFVAEVACPGEELWLVSDRILDGPVVDNSGGIWAALEPGWPLERIRLSEVLLSMLDAGLHRLEVVAGDGSDDFVRAMTDQSSDRGVVDRVHIRRAQRLAVRGLVSSAGALRGRLLFDGTGVGFGGDEVGFSAGADAANRLRDSFLRQHGR